jgi:hypothetical protein
VWSHIAQCAVWCVVPSLTVKDELVCKAVVGATFPFCQHQGRLSCRLARRLAAMAGAIHSSAALVDEDGHPAFACRQPCGGSRVGCDHACTAPCGSCIRSTLASATHHPASTSRVTAVVHSRSCDHRCGRPFVCGHDCDGICHPAGQCPPCTGSCERRCGHSQCSRRCCDPCAACAEPCQWQHTGGTEQLPCPLPCGAARVRLPCDKRCAELLTCGHQCPAVCGEKCPSPAFCQRCATVGELLDSPAMRQVVDLIMGMTLADAIRTIRL